MASLSEFSTSLTGIPLTSQRGDKQSLSYTSPQILTETYDNCEDIISKGRNNASMSYNEKKNLSNDIDRLDAKDHIGILKIIINHTGHHQQKLYTVNNYATYIDLNDLSAQCLWDICYYVKLCLQNQKREKEKQKAHKEFLDERRKLEDQMRHQSKLRLTGRCANTNTSFPAPTTPSSPSDLSTLDFSTPDLSTPDFTNSNLATPDLIVSNLPSQSISNPSNTSFSISDRLANSSSLISKKTEEEESDLDSFSQADSFDNETRIMRSKLGDEDDLDLSLQNESGLEGLDPDTKDSMLFSEVPEPDDDDESGYISD